jgi:hypothetical protein
MNATNAALALVATLAAATLSPVAHAAAQGGRTTIVVTCAAMQRPTLAATAELVGSNNSKEVYDARNRLMAQVRDECAKPGVARVAFTGKALAMTVASR